MLNPNDNPDDYDQRDDAELNYVELKQRYEKPFNPDTDIPDDD